LAGERVYGFSQKKIPVNFSNAKKVFPDLNF
jgi:hypothetical protein